MAENMAIRTLEDCCAVTTSPWGTASRLIEGVFQLVFHVHGISSNANAKRGDQLHFQLSLAFHGLPKMREVLNFLEPSKAADLVSEVARSNSTRTPAQAWPKKASRDTHTHKRVPKPSFWSKTSDRPVALNLLPDTGKEKFIPDASRRLPPTLQDFGLISFLWGLSRVVCQKVDVVWFEKLQRLWWSSQLGDRRSYTRWLAGSHNEAICQMLFGHVVGFVSQSAPPEAPRF